MPKADLQQIIPPKKVFAFNKNQKSRSEPVPFNINDHAFHLRPFVPGVVFLEFAAQAGEGEGASAPEALIDMLRRLIVEDDWERFLEVARDPDEGIGVDELGELFQWAVEIYSDRPTEPPTP